METLNVFEHDEETGFVYLVNRRGKRVPGAEWTQTPRLQSGVFLATYDKVFTVLGDEVNKLETDEVYAIINFWVYYRRGGQRYIARLEPLGLKFRVKAETPVDDVGFLSHEGCVIQSNGEWEIYNYAFGTLQRDVTVPDVQLSASQIYELLKKGFTDKYLIHLASMKSDMLSIQALSSANTLSAWEDANKDLYTVIVRLSELIGEYSAEQLGTILGLKPYIISIIMQYLEINNFIG